jgi:hypothetical protein
MISLKFYYTFIPLYKNTYVKKLASMLIDKESQPAIPILF